MTCFSKIGDPRCGSLVRIGVKRLGINLPPATDTDQRQIVGEVTRGHGAVDDRERRIGTGFVDRENLIMAGQAPFGRRLAPADNLKILVARPISNGLMFLFPIVFLGILIRNDVKMTLVMIILRKNA